ncbi:unnamed protein product [Brachionus calyciflorus]|uniref:Akirin n=1 Tax=Brachionus calyciflorus TaxID=104777 RepID=A0A813T7U9_9BILA|nr:unnamed protein product [Brachionus calyciflorus]
MACCTTISPLNSSQKRRTSAMFDFPHSAKRRRPLSSNNLTNSTSTMFTTSSSLSNKSVIIDSSVDKKQSPFQNIPYSPMSGMMTDLDANENQYKNELMERIRHEAKRLIRRRQLGVSSVNMVGNNVVENSSSESSLTSEPLSPSQSDTNNNSDLIKNSKKSILSHNDVPLFSMNQVNSLCDKMIQEREQFIREQYDKILAQKLNEQYDAFVKFTHEQIQRRFEASQCTYVS